jgi:hypothetical protein
MKIGVFDSGVGGLTVLEALRTEYPQVDFSYLGDTAHVPYGSKSPSHVTALSVAAAKTLQAEGIDLLVVACNTASSVALEAIRDALKQGDVRWRDLIEEKRDGEAGEETSKLQKALAAQEAKKQKPAPAAQPAAPESDGARFYRLLTAAQDGATLDRIMDDARATLKGADLHSAENYALDRRAALAA